MGDIFDRPEAERQEAPKAPDMVYTAPNVRDVYKQWRETGHIPYSYYGVGAPTREGEVEALKRSFPTAFSQPPAPATQAPQSNRPSNQSPSQNVPFPSLFRALGGGRY